VFYRYKFLCEDKYSAESSEVQLKPGSENQYLFLGLFSLCFSWTSVK